MARRYDVVVWGATGFTGQLVCEHLVKHYQDSGVRWAMAGRDRAKLERIRRGLAEKNVSLMVSGLTHYINCRTITIDEFFTTLPDCGLRKSRPSPEDGCTDERAWFRQWSSTAWLSGMQEVPILVGTLDEPASLFAIAQQTKVMVAMAGPYARLGTPIVEACIKGGCHYVDITAEVPWMLDMARKYEQAALDKGICLVHNCGFDSIPCDLTAFFTARFIQEELNSMPGHLDMVIDGVGGVSGGTVASLVGMLFDQEKSIQAECSQPYCLVPPGLPKGHDPPDSWRAQWISALGEWAAPGVMQFINAPVVRKSAALLDYGPHFGYREVGRVPGKVVAIPVVALCTLFIWLVTLFPWLRKWVLKRMPQAGEGPSRAVMEGGFWRCLCYAQIYDAAVKPQEQAELGRMVVVESEHLHADPGYLSTSRLVLEAGLCLALEVLQLSRGFVKGSASAGDGRRGNDGGDGGGMQEKERKQQGCKMAGFPTPAAAMGKVLVERLRRAGVSFRVKSVRGAPHRPQPNSFFG